MSTNNEQESQRDDTYVGGLPEPYLGDRSEVQELPVFFASPQAEASGVAQPSPADVPQSVNVAAQSPGVPSETLEAPQTSVDAVKQPAAADQSESAPEAVADSNPVETGEEVEAAKDAEKPNPFAAMDPNELLRFMADRVLASTKPAVQSAAAAPVTEVSQADLARVAQALDVSKPLRPEQLAGVVDGATPDQQPAPTAGGGTVQVGPGERVQIGGGAALAQGLGALVGGTMAVAGAAARAVGDGARSVANAIRPGDAGTSEKVAGKLEQVGSGLPAVLPRLSEYRVDALEDAAAKYEAEADKFWGSSTKLTALRSEVERVARERGLAVQDVVEKMKPGGDFEELRQKFNAAVSANPDSGARKRGMDKAMDGFIRQFGRAQEELANPEQDGNAHYDGLKARVKKAHERMEEKAGGIPAFANADGELEQTHLERLRDAVKAIMEKVREIAQQFIAMLKGKDTSSEASHEHASP